MTVGRSRWSVGPDHSPYPWADMTSKQPPAPMPGWQYTWMSARPALFLFGAAVLFMALLRLLAPKTHE